MLSYDKQLKSLSQHLRKPRLICAMLLVLIAFACLSEAFYVRAQTREEKTLRISIERSGGFAGITMKTAVDKKDLAPDEALKLHQLVEDADFFNLPREIMPPSRSRDRFQYKLTVEENGRQHTVRVTEEAMPEKLKPLVKWLMERARQSRKSNESR
ncbi:MAG: protealysin inhibitor emfourin [bacterium]